MFLAHHATAPTKKYKYSIYIIVILTLLEIQEVRSNYNIILLTYGFPNNMFKSIASSNESRYFSISETSLLSHKYFSRFSYGDLDLDDEVPITLSTNSIYPVLM